MSSIEKRLQVFRKLPLRAQLATILSSKANAVLSHDESGISRTKFGISSRQNRDYIASLERIHRECLETATPQEKKIYQQSAVRLQDLD